MGCQTDCHRLSVLNDRSVFLTILEAKFKSGFQHGHVLGEPSSWFAGGHLPAMSSDDGERAEERKQVLSQSLVWLHPQGLITSQRPTFKYHCVGGQGFDTCILREHEHSVHSRTFSPSWELCFQILTAVTTDVLCNPLPYAGHNFKLCPMLLSD